MLDDSFVQTPLLEAQMFNPYAPHFHADPYPVFQRLRDQEPIHKSIFQIWVVTSYAYAEAILKDPRFLVDHLPARLEHKATDYREASFLQLSKLLESWIVFLNPPDHSRLKRAISPGFTQEAIESLRPYVESIIANLLGSMANDGSVDLIANLANPLVALTTTRLLGLPDHDASQVSSWCANTIRIFDQPAPLEMLLEQSETLEQFRAYLEQLMVTIRHHPQPGLFSELLQQQPHSGLSDAEIISTLILLAATAQESTKGLFSNGLLALLRHPYAMAELRENRALIPAAVYELMRYDSPIQYVARRAAEDVLFADQWIRQGEYVTVYLAAANRDPAVFPDPDHLNFQRTNRNLGFGGGVHYCVGSFLAKLEMEVVLKALLERFASLELASDCLERSPSRISRRLSSLPVLLRP
jgi:pimeloyl-[acyl-carrier protein] synthase